MCMCVCPTPAQCSRRVGTLCTATASSLTSGTGVASARTCRSAARSAAPAHTLRVLGTADERSCGCRSRDRPCAQGRRRCAARGKLAPHTALISAPDAHACHRLCMRIMLHVHVHVACACRTLHTSTDANCDPCDRCCSAHRFRPCSQMKHARQTLLMFERMLEIAQGAPRPSHPSCACHMLATGRPRPPPHRPHQTSGTSG